jgi:hypothetical protein
MHQATTMNPNPQPSASNRTATHRQPENAMNRYQPRTPRIFAGLAAAALTAATLALTVMAPAALDARGDDMAVVAAGGEDHVYANTGPVTTSIDVVAYRGQRTRIIQSRASARTGSPS